MYDWPNYRQNLNVLFLRNAEDLTGTQQSDDYSCIIPAGSLSYNIMQFSFAKADVDPPSSRSQIHQLFPIP